MQDKPEKNLKVKLIEDINKILLSHSKPALSPKDFDLLYDLTVNELIDAKKQLIKELRLISNVS